MAAAILAKLASDIQKKASSFTPDNEVVRQNLLESARSLVAVLETPSERATRMYHHVFIYQAARILIDTKTYRALAASQTPQTPTQLGKTTGADPELLSRFLKFVAVENHVKETGADQYAANDTTHLLASSAAEGMLINVHGIFKIGDILPAYFKERNYANPASKTESAFHSVSGKHYFEWINEPGNEHELEGFKQHMRFKTVGRKWFEKSELMDAIFGGKALNAEDVRLIDIGGSDGYDITNFHTAHPDMPGRLVLQDLPQTINSLDTAALSAKGVEAMVYDMFTPQPIKGAKVYYLKMVLHDWPKEQCQQALTNIRDAMEPGYSRILLNEILIPDVGAGWFETSLDVLMMLVHAAQERKENEWREMIEGVEGLKVTKVWAVEGAYESVIEIERSAGGALNGTSNGTS